MPYGKKSPAKMGHKDSAMKMGHKDSAMKMESAKQEKYNLLHDNPVAKHGSWMSKHSKSALHMGHSPVKMGHESPAEMGHEGSPAKHRDRAMHSHSLSKTGKNKGKPNESEAFANYFPNDSEGQQRVFKTKEQYLKAHPTEAARLKAKSPAKMHKDDHVDYAAKVKEHDRKQGLLDPKTGKRKMQHTFDYNYAKDNGVITSKKTGKKSFVTAGGKKLPVGPGSPATKHCM